MNQQRLRRRVPGLQHQRHGCGECEQQGRHHAEEHVLDDVHAEQRRVVARDAGLGRHHHDDRAG